MRVRGFDADLVERLRPYVTALPRYTAVNVNTASAPVLAALLPRLSLTQVRQVVEQRDRIPLRNLGDLALYLPQGEGAGEAGHSIRAAATSGCACTPATAGQAR